VRPAIEVAIDKKLRDYVRPNERTSEIKKGLRKNVEDPLAIADFVSTYQGPNVLRGIAIQIAAGRGSARLGSES
jgi:hypothetical protein